MKILFTILLFILSVGAQALTRNQLEVLLKDKGVNLVEIEMKGMKILMGEVTGHINAIPFAKVYILVTENEAILKSEIDSVDFNGSQNLGAVVSLRFSGQYVLKKDVKATIVLGQ